MYPSVSNSLSTSINSIPQGPVQHLEILEAGCVGALYSWWKVYFHIGALLRVRGRVCFIVVISRIIFFFDIFGFNYGVRVSYIGGHFITTYIRMWLIMIKSLDNSGYFVILCSSREIVVLSSASVLRL